MKTHHDMDPNETGGTALVAGFLVVLLVLYRNPGAGWAAATDGLATVVYFILAPGLGLLAGIHSYVGGRHGAVLRFLCGSYLGVFGLALALGGGLGPTTGLLPLGVGVVLTGLSVVALTTSVARAAAAVPSGLLRPPTR